jgi:hypothetical protein
MYGLPAVMGDEVMGNSGKDCYVYIYIDPRNFEWFYVGKGKGSRKEAHLFDRKMSEKANRIKDIRKAKLDPIIRVVASGLTDREALLVEKTLIWQSQGRLLNASSGHFKDEFRPPNTLHRELPKFDFHKQIYYFNVGHGKCGRWEDNVKYEYIGAGHGPKFRDAIKGLSEGDVVVAHLSGAGYVGVGVVLAKAQPAREFRVNGRLLIDHEGLLPEIKKYLHDDEYCQWMVPVRWHKTVKRSAAFWKSKAGLFAARLVRASLKNQPETIRFVERCFKVDLFKLADS